MASRLASRCLEVVSLTTDRSHALPRAGQVDGVPVHRFKAYPKSRDYYFSPALFVHLLRNRYDLIHVQGANNTLPFYAILAALITRTPFLITFHSGGPTTRLRSRLRRLQFRLLGMLARHAARLVAVSEFEAGVVAAATGQPRERIEIIRNGGLESLLGIPDEEVEWPLEWTPADGAVLLTTSGRLERYKGHHRAITAFPLLRQRVPGAQLLILGVGPERDALLATARACGVAEDVHVDFVPPSSRLGLIKILRRSDLVLLLSDYEAHPVAVMEAVAAGTKSLVCLNSGMTELVGLGWASGVASDGSPSDVADAMEAALASDMGPATDRLPTWDGCADALHKVYADVLDERRRSRVR